MEEQFVYKNRLQEYAQRSSLPLPIYQTINEGSPHAPLFRSSVTVDGAVFRSPCTFSSKKAAEQHVAKYAFEAISDKIKNEGIPLIHNDIIFCKSVLNEYAIKMKLQPPKYQTSQGEGILPVFISSVLFDGKSYTGSVGRNKKEAEQLAARTVIEIILGSSDSRILMSEIIKSKGKLYALMHKGPHAKQAADMVVGIPIMSNNSVKGKEVQAASTYNTSYVISHPSEHFLQLPPNVAINHSIPLDAKEPELGYTYPLSPGSSLSAMSLPVLPESNPSNGSTTALPTTINSAPHAQLPVQVKIEIPSDDPVVHPNNSLNMVPTSRSKKRRNKNKGKSEVKKACTEEKPPSMPLVNNEELTLSISEEKAEPAIGV